MTQPLLALDLGNSRLKACLLPDWDGAPSVFLEGHSELDEWLGQPSVLPRAVGLASVASEERTHELARRLEDTLALRPRINPDCGLALDLETPDTTGRDRLYAARAAVEMTGHPCVVVDAGTALTVDAVRPGVFLGGAIAPGPGLLARALSDGGARLCEIEPEPGAEALGRSTRAALRSGVAVGFEGAALHLVERVAAEAGLAPDAPVVLTGGARGFLTQVLEAAARPLRVDPLLVLRGLARALDG